MRLVARGGPRGRANTEKRLKWIWARYGSRAHAPVIEVLVILGVFRAPRSRYDALLPWLAREFARGGRPLTINEASSRLPRITDWAQGARVDGRKIDIGRYTWDEADAAQEAWHEELAARARRGDVEQAPVFLRLRSGWTWQELRPRHLKEEGEAMGHCVGEGGYAAQIASGRSRILSLRDARGRPHVTVEFEQRVTVADPTPTWEVVQVQGKGDVPPAAKYHPAVRRLFLRVLGPMASWGGEANAYWPDAFLWRQARTRWTRVDLDALRIQGRTILSATDREVPLGGALHAFARTLSWAEGRSREGQDPLETGLASLRGWYWENGKFGLVFGFPWVSLVRGDAQVLRTALLEARWSWEDIDAFPREDADWLLGRAAAMAERAAASELDRDLIGGLRDGWRWERPLPRRTSPEDWSVERAHALVDRLLLSVDRWARRRGEVLAETIRELLPAEVRPSAGRR